MDWSTGTPRWKHLYRLKNFPLAIYVAEHWVEHAQLEGVSLDTQDLMTLLFDSFQSGSGHMPHYTVFVTWAKTLVIERSQYVNSRRAKDNRTLLFVSFKGGTSKVTRMVLNPGTAGPYCIRCRILDIWRLFSSFPNSAQMRIPGATTARPHCIKHRNLAISKLFSPKENIWKPFGDSSLSAAQMRAPRTRTA